MKKEISQKKKNLVYGVCGLIMAVAIFAIVIVLGTSDWSDSEANPTPEVTEAAVLDFPTFYAAYKENELVADDTYQYNRYRLSGIINQMTDDGLFNMGGKIKVTLQNTVDNTIVFFFAEFEKDQAEALKTVKVGDTITFEGKCLGAGNWSECELILE